MVEFVSNGLPALIKGKPFIERVTDHLASKFFIRTREPAYLSVTRIPEYKKQLPEIEQLYAIAGLWHGTGRYQYRDGKKIDVLEGIILHGGLMPSQDGWDPATGEVNRVSTADSRMYARLYAGMYFEEGHELANPCGDTKLWVNYFMSSLAMSAGMEVLREFVPITKLLLTKGKHFWSELQKKYGFNLAKNADRWMGKVTKGKMPILNLFTVGSDISGNYPILIGIKEVPFVSAATSKSIKKHERRTATPIGLDDITHIEVPIENVPETKTFLHAKGRDDIPVVGMEFGEEYCRGVAFSKLVKGGTINPKDRVGVKSTTEISFIKPESIIKKDLLARYAPQPSWFYSLKRALNSVHDIGHHGRVLILQEVLAQYLIETGEVFSTIDREALRWAAVLHDVRRRSDVLSHNHGADAASWADSVLPSDLPDATRHKIKFILEHHDENNQALLEESPELAILEEADKLERCRLEHLLPPQTPTNIRRKVGLNPTYLHYLASSKFIPLSELLFLLSRQNKKKYRRTPFQGVMDAATVLGIVK
ncbi:HD domain-containing protein [Candidatus Microgenomates bacterium]|nr:HD domain-containing protein [Candidatus Microgenomates bacterium]